MRGLQHNQNTSLERRYRKKNRGLLGLNRDNRTQKSTSKRGIDGSRSGINTFARDTGVHRMVGKRQVLKSKLREEEQAAFLLMALSNSYVYA
ncbi:hypothetical protein V6N13_020618 [Hibiscus sabdariffa]|uniref:Uncharacterized protein n=1 Tax=Hibiscus sabdariffa TaxID=183260 RepID=A0ABR2EUK9_9ROSI